VHRRRLRAEAEGRLCWYFPAFVSAGGPDAAPGHGAVRGYVRRGLAQGGAAASWALRIDGRVLEVVILAVFTGLSNYPHMLTRMLQGDGIKALFSQCSETPGAAAAAGRLAPRDPLGFCGAQDTVPQLLGLVALLLGASLLRFFQTVVTIGALTPAGLFVPSLFMGGCFGRAVGGLLKYAGLPGAGGFVEPGIYAMVGAGAMLAGVSRLTLSLAVVLFELTGGLTYVVPFMLAVLMGKWTGDLMTNGRSIYDVHAELKGFTKVEPPDDVRLLNATLDDLVRVPADAEGEKGGKAAASPPALWSTSRPSDSALVEHARRVQAPGFVVVTAGTPGSHAILGWVDCQQVLGLIDSQPAQAQKIYRPWRSPGGKPQELQPPQWINRGAVVQVRCGCPLQTVYCVFENCAQVQAVVYFDEASGHYHTVTRELFQARLSQGCLQPQGSIAAPARQGAGRGLIA